MRQGTQPHAAANLHQPLAAAERGTPWPPDRLGALAMTLRKHGATDEDLEPLCGAANGDAATANGAATAPGVIPHPRTARDAIALLAAKCDDLRFCGNHPKGNAYETGWQRKQRPTDPNEWPTKWWRSETFCIVMSTAGLYLVDVDAAFDIVGDHLVERLPTKAEAKELADALGGKHHGYESTPGKSHWHIVYGDPGNGGREWSIRSRAGFASQNGLLWKSSSGAFLQFDTRGGGRYRGGAKDGQICGARIDADKRRILKLLAALEEGVTPIEHTNVLYGAMDFAHGTPRPLRTHTQWRSPTRSRRNEPHSKTAEDTACGGSACSGGGSSGGASAAR